MSRLMAVVAAFSIAMGVAGSANAQAMGGAQRLLRGICLLWFKSGGDGAAVAKAAAGYGFKALHDNGKVIALETPESLAASGFATVSFDSGGEHPARCSITVHESGQDRSGEVRADLDAWAGLHEPMWNWTKATPAAGPSGQRPLYAWETPTHVMTLSRAVDMFNPNAPGSWSTFVEIARKN